MKDYSRHFSRTYIISLVIAVAIMITLSLVNYIPDKYPCHNGTLDLSSYPFDDNSSYRIGNAFDQAEISDNKYFDIYSITIVLPEGTQDVAFSIPQIFTSIKLVVNNKAIYSQDKGNMVYPIPRIINYRTDSNVLNVRLCLDKDRRMNNSPYTSPTHSSMFRIGSVMAINKSRNYSDTLSFVVIIICLSASVLHLSLFFVRGHSKLHLNFCIMAVAISIEFMFSRGVIIRNAVPNLNLIDGYRINLVVQCIKNVVTLQYIKEAFHDTYSSLLSKFFFSVNGIIVFAVLTSSHQQLSALVTVINVLFALIILSTVILTIVKKTYSSDTIAFLNSEAFLILLIGAYSDFAHSFAITPVNTMITYCMIMFIIFQSFIISVNYQNACNNISRLASELKSSVYELQDNKSTFISSHLKPSFLYETLDSISEYCGNDNEKTDKLIQALAKYLRQSIDYNENDENYSLKTEIDISKAYAVLVSEQHPEIKISFDIDDNIPSAIVPQLCIQTLIENSVSYAFEGVLQPHVYVNIHYIEEEDAIEINVTDNGMGMTPDELKFVLVIPNKHLSIGLYYINQRLIDMGMNGLLIESRHRKGTSVTFKVQHVELEVRNEFF